jgi:hypothetical protein
LMSRKLQSVARNKKSLNLNRKSRIVSNEHQ